MGIRFSVAGLVAVASAAALIGPPAGIDVASAAVAEAMVIGLPRATRDRVDDLALPQIHVIYAIAADGDWRDLDVDGSLQISVSTSNGWLRAQTPGRALRFDTYAGQLDITSFRSSFTGAELAKDPALARTLGDELAKAGFTARNKKYAVYYDGPSMPLPCGGAAWPPTVPGQAGVVYLQSSCAQPLGASLTRVGYWEVAMLHEILHTLGIVGACAPNYQKVGPRGHVRDDPTDLMWAGAGDWLPGGPHTARLDPGHDDYYKHRRRGCPDLDNSPYLTTAAVPSTLDVPLAPARLAVGTSTSTVVKFSSQFRSVDDVCVDVAIIGDPPGLDEVSMSIDPSLPAVTGTPGPAPGGTGQLPHRSVSMCLDGPEHSAHRSVFGDGEQTISLTTTTGTVDVMSVVVRLAGVPTPTVAINPPIQTFTATAAASPLRVDTGETVSGVINLGTPRFSVLDEACFTIDFADDRFDLGEELTIELVGRGVAPLVTSKVIGNPDDQRERCLIAGSEAAALAVIATGGPVAIAVTATAGSVSIAGMHLDITGSRDTP